MKWRPERASQHRLVVVVSDRIGLCRRSSVPKKVDYVEQRQLGRPGQIRFGRVRWHPSRRGGRWRALNRQRRNLSQRKVLRETTSRQPLCRAREKREKRAPGWVWGAGAAGEPSGDTRPSQRCLQKAGIELWGADKNSHTVERHPTLGLEHGGTCHFHTLSALARRREHCHLGSIDRLLGQLGRTVGREQKSPDPTQLAGVVRFILCDRLNVSAGQSAQHLHGPVVSVGYGREDLRRPRTQRPDQPRRRFVPHSNVEQQQWTTDG